MNGIVENLFSQGIWEALKYGWSLIRRWRYVRVLGGDVIRTDGPCVTVGALRPPVGPGGNPFVFAKPGTGLTFSTSLVIGGCELRAASYIGESIALNARNWSLVVPDDEIENRLDLSFVSIGP